MASRIGRLLSRKAEVSIELGRLVVRQPNGKDVNQDWLKNYSKDIVAFVVEHIPSRPRSIGSLAKGKAQVS